MKLIIQMDRNNAVFDENKEFETQKLLLNVIKQFGEGFTSRIIRDDNGNSIGRWTSSLEDEA